MKAHLARWPDDLDADVRRVAAAEGVPVSHVERKWMRAMVDLYDQTKDTGAPTGWELTSDADR